jgi:hypothetical protein
MATEIVAITSGVNAVHARQLAPVAANLTAVERHALVVADPIAVFDASGVAAAIVNAREVVVAMILALDPLCAAFVAVRLEVGEAAFIATATFHSLHLALAAASVLDGELTAFASAATFHALRLAFTATTLDLESTLPTAATMALGALHLHLAAAATATLCFLAAAALGLRLAIMSAAALIGLGSCRSGYRKCRDTGCKDELPHHKSPIGSQQERPCYGGVPLFGTEWERPSALG